jgi:glycosyltransferase involved in cell wall biosynthesis
MTIKPNILHIVNGIFSGGVAQGIITLQQGGFYDPFNLHVVELRRGNGAMRDKLEKIIGTEHIITLSGDWNESSRLVKYTHNLTEFFTLVKELRTAFKNLSPAAIILSGTYPHLVGRRAASGFPDIKVVSFEHNTYVHPTPVLWALRLTARRNDLVFADANQTLRERLLACYPPNRRTSSRIVPLAMLEVNESREVKTPEVFHVVSMGRLIQKKNFSELIHAVAQLIKEGIPAKLTIAGEGPQRQELENIIKNKELSSDQIALPGFLVGEPLNSLRNSADIYVQPSEEEGFCLTLAEAMAAGTPSAATPFSGRYEYGTPDNMIMIEGYSRRNIADGLRDLISHYSEVAPGIVKAAVETIKSRYTREPVMRLWREAIEDIQSPRQPLPPSGVLSGYNRQFCL